MLSSASVILENINIAYGFLHFIYKFFSIIDSLYILHIMCVCLGGGGSVPGKDRWFSIYVYMVSFGIMSVF